MLTDWYVASGPGDPHEDGTPEHPFNQIQEAATAAASGDTVLVLPGTYTGPGNRDITTAGKSLTFRSTGGAAATTLDAQGTAGENHRVFLIEGGEVTLDGLTLTGAYAGEGGAVWGRSAALTVLHSVLTGNSSSGWGAAVYVVRGGAVRLEESTFSQNTAAGHGGAAMVENSPHVEITGCSFTDNTAQADGGAVRAYNVGTLVLTDSTWTGNHAGSSGGAIWAGLGSQLTFAGTNSLVQNSAASVGGAVALTNISTVAVGGSATFTGNESGGHGGAVYLDYCVTAGFTAAAFEDNTSPADGGAIFALASGTLSLADSTFDGNHAGWGGAIEGYYVRHVQIAGGSLRGNVASGSGGGLRLIQCVDSQVTGTRFEQNSAQGNGGAVESDQNQHLRLVDNTFTANRSENGSAGAVMLSNLQSGEVTGNNQFLGNYARWDGGAIYVQYSGSVTIDGATVSGNTADQHVGGILVLNAQLTLTGSVLSSNTAKYFVGALHLGAQTAGTICGNMFENNTAGDGGGGIDLAGGTATIADNLLQGNQANGHGGAISLRAGSLATIVGNRILKNVSQTGVAGGIYLESSKARILQNLIQENASTQSAGGGLYANWSPCWIEGNVWLNNFAAMHGTAVAANASNAILVNNLIYADPQHPENNPALAQLRGYALSGFVLANNVVWGAPAQPSLYRNWEVAYHVYYSDLNDAAATGDGNFSQDPRFVNPASPLGADGRWQTDDDGFRLAPDSPCRDAGDPAFQDAGATRSDVGAYSESLPWVAASTLQVDAANTSGPWDGTAGHPYRHLWQALWAASNGTTVLVAPGTYPANVSVWQDGLTIRGAGATTTVLDGGGAAGIFSLRTVQDFDLSGFTLTDGFAWYGGAVQAFDSSLTLHDNAVTNNVGMRVGGAIACEGGSGEIASNEFFNNAVGGQGGAIWAGWSAFHITGNVIHDNAAQQGGGIHLWGSGHTLDHNLIYHNEASGEGGGIFFWSGQLQAANLTVADNTAASGGGIYAGDATLALKNSIVWDNTAPTGEQFSTGGTTALTVSYSDVEGAEVWPGTGNLNADPLFANPAPGDPSLADYHVLSQYGRWDPRAAGGAGAWILDGVTSPAIDAGDPADAVGDEPAPHGGRINLGADGGTDEASKSASKAGGEPAAPGKDGGGSKGDPPSRGPGKAGPQTRYVDDDALHDPGLGDPLVSDPAEDGSSEHPFDSLQEAIDASSDGDTVLVLPGTYTGQGNRDVSSRGRTLTIQSSGGAQATTFDAQGIDLDRHRILSVSGGGALTLDGFTLTGGYAADGGAIWCSFASLTVLHSVLTANVSTSWGGAIYVVRGGVIDLEETTFDQNTAAGHGGAVAAENCASLQIVDSTLTANTARADGGAVRAHNIGSLTLTDNSWTGNHADASGGAVWAGLTAQFAVGGDNAFTNNTANSLGGAVALTNLDVATFTGQPAFSANTANGHGGAVYAEYCSSVSFTAATLAGNTSHQSGGAVLAYYTDTLSFTGTTLTGNHADGNGGAINATVVHDVQLAGGTLTGNVASGYGGGLGLYSCVRSVVNGTRFEQNAATANGGALDSDQNQLIRLIGVTFSANRTENGVGGAMMLSNLGQGELTGDNRFLNNYARWDAGAIFVQYAGSVTLAGATITGNRADRHVGAVEIVNQSQAVVSGCTISQNTAQESHGAVIVQSRSRVTFTGNVIADNHAADFGGALDVHNATATLEDNLIQGNSSGDAAGAISVRAGAAITMRQNRVLANSAADDGGGLRLEAASYVLLVGNTISHNTAGSLGGGVRIIYSTGTLELRDNLVDDNTAGGNGGGLETWANTSGLFVGNTFRSNHSTNGSGGGVMLASYSGLIVFDHNTVTDNDARWEGGGVDVADSTAHLTNNDIRRNTATGYGSGVYVYNGSACLMAGNQVIGNSGDGILLNHAAGGRLEDNEVTGNTGAGIALVDGFTTGVTLSRNRTYGNGGPGLDLNRDGVTVNDPGDGDSGPNLLLNNPVLSLGSGAASGFVRVQGTAGAGQTVEVFRAEGTADYGEASAYLGPAVADAAGGFFLDVPDTNFWVTATSTDAAGNTSELSAILQTGAGTVYLVNTPADNTLTDGWLSLREAIDAANCDCAVGDAPPGHGADIIRFDPVLMTGQTITLNGNQLVVTPSRLSPGSLPDVTIIGLGRSQLTIDAHGQTRHFEVNPGAALAMSALTLINGNAGEGFSGGSILCDGTLDLTDVLLTTNRAGKDGGAIYASDKSPAVTLTNCDLINNRAAGNGGGIDQLGGTLTITGGNVTNNRAVDKGGGIEQLGGTLTITGGNVNLNTANFGGGAFTGGLGSVVITGGTFDNNTAVIGGGIFSGKALTITGHSSFTNNTAACAGAVEATANLTMTDVLVSGNSASSWAGGVRAGGASNLTRVDFERNTAAGFFAGGIAVLGNSVFAECTFNSNTANTYGGAVFVVGSGSVVAQQSHFTNNSARNGGAIYVLGSFTASQCEFTGNRATSDGGAMWNVSPVLVSVQNSTFTTNTAGGSGGAICHTATLTRAPTGPTLVIGGNTLFDSNTAAAGDGGAIWNSGPAAVADSTFQANKAAGNGGAMYLGEDDFSSTISACEFKQNEAGTDGSGSGGAIWTSQRRVEITTGTRIWQNNKAASDGGGLCVSEGFTALADSLVALNAATNGRGGGLFVDTSGELDFVNSTMSGNASGQAGGGFYFNDVANTVRLVNATVAQNRADAAGLTGQAGGGIYTATAKILLQNTIVAANVRGTGSLASDVQGLLDASSSHSLVGDAGSFGGLVDGVNHNDVGSDPQLGPLQDNGGRSWTQALLAGSPAIDGGDNALALAPGGDPLWYDQRGPEFDRVVGLHVDLGAYEFPQPGGRIEGRKWFDLDQDGSADANVWGLSIAANGGFEQGPSIGSWTTLNAGDTRLVGWQVPNMVQWIGTYWTSAENGRSIHLYGSTGSLAQVLTTEPGRRYRVQFAMAGHPDTDQGVKTLRISAAGTYADFTFDTTGRSRTNMGWVTMTWEFVAQGSRTVLAFQSRTAGTAYGPVIDGVVVQPFGRDDIRIYLDSIPNGTFDAGEPLAFLRPDNPHTPTVDETGTYRFTGLPADAYTVREALAAGLQQLAPAAPGSYQVTVTGQETHSGLDFGNRWTGEIHGTKFIDLNNNGLRDRNPLPTTAPTVLMVVDVSNSSTRNAGFTIADQNGDGLANTVLDAEIYAMLTLRQELVSLGWGATAQVRVIAFASDAVQLDMDPAAAGAQWTTAADADTDANGVKDVEQVLKSLRAAPSGTSSGKTDYEAALQAAVATLTAHPPAGPTVMFFTSDGRSNDPWVLGDELASLDALGVARTAWGFGDICELSDLRRIDPYAQQLTSTAQIVEKATARSRSGAGDGRWLEPGLAGVTIYLDANGNGLLDTGELSTVSIPNNPSTSEDETGWYAFTDLPIGSYVVREEVPTGYVQTAPKDPYYYTVDLRSSPLATGYDFGNAPTSPCVIRGHKGLDADRDGVFADGEPYQSGVTFYLDYDRDGVLDPGEPTAVTDATGTFQFTVAPGTYLVREVPASGFLQVVPASAQGIDVHLDPGQTSDTLLFVNQDVRGCVAGFKWEDTDGNGTHEPGEPGLAGVRIYLDVNNNGNWDSPEPYALTQADDPTTTGVDETGQWKIENVVAGTYVVREVCPSGYTPNPANGHAVTVQALEAVQGILFFNAPILCILSGWKYDDLNRNGERDRNRLQGDLLVLVVDASDSTRYAFAGTPPGDVNNDAALVGGAANDKLDGELAGLIAVNQTLIAAGLGDTLEIAIVAFTNLGYEMKMDPTAAGPQWTTTPAAGAEWRAKPLDDKDGDGIHDVEQVLRSITRQIFGNELRTSYDVALQTVGSTIQAAGVAKATMLFLSDGEPNNPSNYADEVATLRNRGTTLSAFGAGSDATLYTLKIIDPDADVFTSSADLVTKFFGSADLSPSGGSSVPGSSDGLWAEPGLPGIRVYIDANNNGQLDWTDGNGNGTWDLGEGERWTLSQDDDPGTTALDETGFYRFDNLQPGNYIIREVVLDGWQGVPLVPYLLDESLTTYFRFNGGAVDSISGAAATNHGATGSNDRFAQATRAYAFDGTQWMSVSLAELPVDDSSRTLSLWVRSADGEMDFSGEHVAAWGQADTSQAFGFACAWGGQWGAYLHGGADIGTGVAPDASWHQLVVTYDGTTAALYLDGKLKNSAARDLVTAAGPLILAVRPDLLANSYFDGALDDIRIYDRVLASNEVAALYGWEATRDVLDDRGYVVRLRYGDVVKDVNFGDFVNDPGTLIVTRFVPADTGFVARVSRALDPSVLNLYDSAAQTLGPADVTVTGARVGLVRGSLVVSADQRQITFVRTGGLLEPDTYTVTLSSGATRFREPGGETLDGNADGTRGDDYQTTFTVSARPAGTVTISLPDLARGAGQSVNVPNTAAGLPIRLDNAAGVTSLAVDVMYDPALLQITVAALAAGLPGDWSVVNPPDTSTPGMAKIRASGITPLSGTSIDVVRLTAAVPGVAPYGAVQAIRLENVSLNSGSIAAVGDVAVHKAAYLGDADGSGIHSSADAFLTVQTALGLASGFAAHAWTDPRIVGDADGSGVLSAADAFLIVQEGLGLSEPFVPDNPHIGITPVGGGVDPQYQIDVNLPASVGGFVSVPVKLAIEPAATNVGAIEFDLFFDPSQLTIQLPGGVSAGADTAAWVVTAQLVAPGHLRVGMVSSRGQPLAPGLWNIARLRFHVEAQKSSRTGWQPVRDGLPTRPTLQPPITDVLDGSETHPTLLDIEPVDLRAGGYTWTAVDGSVAMVPPSGRLGAAQACDRCFGDREWERIAWEALLAELAGDITAAWNHSAGG